VHPPGAHLVDERRQPPRRPRDEDAVVRRALGKTELARTEGEHRGKRALEVQLALVDLAQQPEEVGLDDARAVHHLASGSEQLHITQRCDFGLNHGQTVASRFSTPATSH